MQVETPSILILAIPGDNHASAVAAALRRKGAEPALWYTTDFPNDSTETVEISDGKERVRIRFRDGREISSDVTVVWNRRAPFDSRHRGLHFADRPFADVECRRFRTGLFSLLSSKCRWVNPWQAAIAAENKLWQHHLALDSGLNIPKTLYTNDPQEIRDFIDSNPDGVVYKPFRGSQWTDGDRSWGCFTTSVDHDKLVPDPLLRAVPGIYQRRVPKAFELRVTVIGGRPFAAKIRSQETAKGLVDWRRAYDELAMERFELPPPVVTTIQRLMMKLQLAFGCLDFIVTPDGDYVFLEVNQQGQFIFVEQYAGLPLVDAMAEFLLQGGDRLQWSEGEHTLRFRDVYDESREESRVSIEEHGEYVLPEVDERTREQRENADARQKPAL